MAIAHLNHRDDTFFKDVEIPNFYIPPTAVLYDGDVFVRQTPQEEREPVYVLVDHAVAVDAIAAVADKDAAAYGDRGEADAAETDGKDK